jgi:hypothetical protein
MLGEVRTHFAASVCGESAFHAPLVTWPPSLLHHNHVPFPRSMYAGRQL